MRKVNLSNQLNKNWSFIIPCCRFPLFDFQVSVGSMNRAISKNSISDARMWVYVRFGFFNSALNCNVSQKHVYHIDIDGDNNFKKGHIETFPHSVVQFLLLFCFVSKSVLTFSSSLYIEGPHFFGLPWLQESLTVPKAIYKSLWWPKLWKWVQSIN